MLVRAFAALFMLALASAACTSWAPLSQPLPEQLPFAQHIRVTTVDGVTFQMIGVPSEPIRIEDGTLIGPLGEGTVSLPLADIAHVEVFQKASGRKTTLAVIGVVAIGALLLLLMSGVTAGEQP